MTLRITVELLNRTFRGRAGDQSETTWPPSPVRLLGALLRGAHSLDGADDPDEPSGLCALARQALARVTAAAPPIIIAPEPPVELAHRTTWFAPRDAGDDKEGRKKLVAQPPSTASFNRVPKSRTVSLLPLGNEVRFYVAVDVMSDQHWLALKAAAAAVPFFGSSIDHAQITIEQVDSAPEPSPGEHVWRPAPAGSADTGAQLRTWTPDTIAWLDDNHAHGGASIADWRVRTTRYTQRPLPASSSGPRVGGTVHMLTLRAPITLRSYAERVAAVPGWDGAGILPAVEFNAPDRVRGIGLYGAGSDAALAVAPEELLDQSGLFPGSFTSWELGTWIGPAPRWQSATASAAHRDPRVARMQLDTELRSHGLRLTALSRSPLARWHSRQLAVPSNYGLWFLTAEAVDPDSDPVTGPIRIGECLPSGAGLLTPIRT
jgi:hypothetical protein